MSEASRKTAAKHDSGKAKGLHSRCLSGVCKQLGSVEGISSNIYQALMLHKVFSHYKLDNKFERTRFDIELFCVSCICHEALHWSSGAVMFYSDLEDLPGKCEGACPDLRDSYLTGQLQLLRSEPPSDSVLQSGFPGKGTTSFKVTQK